MDKEMIEKIALEVGDELPDMDGGSSSCIEFAHAFLARIDAERGKGAVATKLATDNPFSCFKVSLEDSERLAALPPGTQLFLSPTIPEGMALVPVIPTPAMCAVISNEHDIYGSAQELYAMVLQAAQGERNEK